MIKHPASVLITGAAGFIGFHLACYYQNAGFSVIGVDNPQSFTKDDIRHARLDILKKNIQLEYGNLAELSFCKKILADSCPKIIFHLAAYTDARSLDANRFNNDNIVTCSNMLQAAMQHPPAHFLIASSSSVYNANSSRPLPESAASVRPDNLYGASKSVTESIAGFWAISKAFPITCLRFFNVYGAWGRPAMAPFHFADCLAHNRKVPIITGEALRAWLYIDDAVQACVHLASMPPSDTAFQAVNIAGPQLIQTIDVLKIIAKQMNKIPEIVQRPPKFPETTAVAADLSLLQALTDSVPQTLFVDGIQKFLIWHSKEWLPGKGSSLFY